MPFRTWMYVFAIIGLTLPTSGQAQEDVYGPIPEPQTTESNPPKKSDTAPERTAPPLPPQLDPSAKEHEKDGENGPRDNFGEYPDIIRGDGWAQWLMAVLAFTGVCISGWAVWLLRGTLKATVSAIKEGEKATAAALRAADEATLANQIMRDEQRPWLRIDENPKGIEGMDGIQGEDGLKVLIRRENGKLKVSAQLTVEHFGRDPATKVNVIFQILDNFKGGLTEDPFFTEVNTGRGNVEAQSLFAGDTFTKTVETECPITTDSFHFMDGPEGHKWQSNSYHLSIGVGYRGLNQSEWYRTFGAYGFKVPLDTDIPAEGDPRICHIGRTDHLRIE